MTCKHKLQYCSRCGLVWCKQCCVEWYPVETCWYHSNPEILIKVTDLPVKPFTVDCNICNHKE